MAELSHIDEQGEVRMVDITATTPGPRVAVADAVVRFAGTAALDALRAGATAKGNVLATARLAGIMGAKRAAELIPLCHPIALDHVAVDIDVDAELPGLRIAATARCRAATGVEMEALTAAAVTALTIIDMLKAVDRWISIESVRLREKHGGRHGDLARPPGAP